uniref:Cytochrome c biogenesis protein CcsA n=1 Tax=Codium arabicum TaxID=221038 RepID=A0A386B0I6_CODAR|nr:cytochrome c biogenesis protein ccs1 [Codium arabicum]AYC65199.1 cytochrome c biogenesis protein ccs1 [Codium arabicum]
MILNKKIFLEMIETVISNFCFISLFFTMLVYWIQSNFRIVSKNLTFGSLCTSNFMLFLLLSVRWYESHHFPISNLFYESLLFICWSFTSLQCFFEVYTSEKWLGILITPVTFIIFCFNTCFIPVQFQISQPLIPALQSNWLVMHVTVMLISYASLICGSLLEIAFLLLFYSNLKSLISYKQTILIKLDHYSYRLISFGFPFLTLGILSGAIWANEAWGSYWSWDPKETWAFITWIVFAIYLHTRYIYNWSGFKSSILGSFGFIIIWICYIGVNLLGKGLHSYGWLI